MKILVPIKSKIKPLSVDEELKKFKKIHKSPYSQSYYNTENISWEYKPEGSLRISDHWNFESRGKKHCELYNIKEYIEDSWILAKYKDGKYYILKEFGKGEDGYIYKILDNKQIELLKSLYELGGIEKSYNWYKNYSSKPPFVKEGYIKNIKKLSKYISIDRLRKFKCKKPKAKKIIFIEDEYINIIEKILDIYIKGNELNNLIKDGKNVESIFKDYNAYKFEFEKYESEKEVYILVLDNNIAIDFN